MTFYHSIQNVKELQEILKKNEHIVILRFTADWCGPCKRMEPLLQEWFQTLPQTIDFYNLNVDDNAEVYSFFKSKRRVNGIPALLCFAKGNGGYIPDEYILGGAPQEFKRFTEKCRVLHERISTFVAN